MMRLSWLAAPIAVLFVAMTPVLPSAAAAAQDVRTLDIGGPPSDTTARACISDSIVTAALAAFNSPDAVRQYGGGQIPAGATIVGSYNVFQGQFKLEGTVRGNVTVLNGAARVTRTGVVTGTITVLGGPLILDPGATVGGQFNCEGQPALRRLPSGIVARETPRQSLGSLTSGIALSVGSWRITPHLGIGQYNRVEALPIEVGVNAYRRLGTADSMRVQFVGIGRTGRDPSGSRSAIGWHTAATFLHAGGIPVRLNLEGGSTIEATVDRPYPAPEAGASAFLLRRDYYDWYLRRGGSITASVQPMPEVTVTAGYDVSHETTVPAVEAVSILRSSESWRPNPLVDDGTYRTMIGRIVWDARNPAFYPVLSWFIRAEIHHVSSSSLTPVSVPTTIRDALPTTGYSNTEGELDVRGSVRLGPDQRMAFRFFGGGYISGDPLTIQRRRAIGGADPLLGYDFRSINCDRQRKQYPSTPALCDRTASIQVEYHRALPVDLHTRIGGYTIAIRKPELVVFGDAGSAWLAGDSAGRVPAGRIQSLGEWRSDIGAGITSGPFGLYLAKALTDAIPIRLIVLFNRRF